MHWDASFFGMLAQALVACEESRAKIACSDECCAVAQREAAMFRLRLCSFDEVIGCHLGSFQAQPY